MIDYLSIDPTSIQDGKFVIPFKLAKLFLSNDVFGSKTSLYYRSSNTIFRFTISMYNIEYLLSVRKLISEEKIQLVNHYVSYVDELLFELNLINITNLYELNSELILKDTQINITKPDVNIYTPKVNLISNKIVQKINDVIMYKKYINCNTIQKCHRLLLSGYKISGIEEVFDILHKQNVNNNMFILGIGYGICNKKDWDIQPFLSESVLKGRKYDEPFKESAVRGLFEELSIQLMDVNLLDNNEYQHNENTMIYTICAKDCIACNSIPYVNNYTNKDNYKKKVGVVIYGLYEEVEQLLKVCYPYDKTEKISYYGMIPLNILNNRYQNITGNKNMKIISSSGIIKNKLLDQYNPY
jgi:hypothetical protein